MNKLKFKLNNLIGALFCFLGFKCKYSTGICGSITSGYGKLDDNGYWQFPVYK